MSHRSLAFKRNLTAVLAIVIAVVLLMPAVAAAQAQPAAAKAPAKAWSKKMPDGQPDIQGFWSTTTSAPLERNVNCGTKEFWTDEEMAKGVRTCAPPAGAAAAQPAGGRGGAGQRGAAAGGRGAAAQQDNAANVHYDTAQFGLTLRTSAVNSRTSLIVGPEGRIPPLTPFGQQRQAELAQVRTNLDGPEKRPITERCIVWTAQGPPMMSPGYNSNLQIVQGEGYVMIMPEMMQDARIVPLKPRGALSENVRTWGGDSQGRWEGDTLVVETTNFNGRNPFQRVGSEKMKLTERFKRLDEKTLLYEFTVDDPVWTKPWTVQVPWAKSEGPLFEYACHEGNYGMYNILSGARAAEKAAAEAAKGK
jgi:hypothetical protein